MLGIMYNITMRWAIHRHAPIFLAIISFAESSFFPIPPDLMLAPMSMAKPKLAWRYALLATCFSMLGGLFGYFLGVTFEPAMIKLINKFGYMEAYTYVQHLFNRFGFLAVVCAGATPIPYKIFTIGAGILRFNIFYFIIASFAGRGLRFFMVSSLMKFQGNKIEYFFRNNFNQYGKVLLISAIVLMLIYIFIKFLFV
jgi:membrane protein YqaA with SNARE-associated domain